MIIPEIKQEPLIVKNNWVNYRVGETEIPFYIDYASEYCFEGQDEKGEELYDPELMNDLIHTNHNYKRYKSKPKVIFPFREKAYCGYLVKKEEKISECIDEQFGIMFRVPTDLLIDYKLYMDQPIVEFYERGHFYASGEKYFHFESREIRKGRIINFYKEDGKMVFIVLTHKSGYFTKLHKENFISMSKYNKVNSYYRYGEETDIVKNYE